MFVVFDFADKELPVYFALMATYLIAAYVILPYAVRMGLKVAQRRHVPSFTTAADGLLADPVIAEAQSKAMKRGFLYAPDLAQPSLPLRLPVLSHVNAHYESGNITVVLKNRTNSAPDYYHDFFPGGETTME